MLLAFKFGAFFLPIFHKMSSFTLDALEFAFITDKLSQFYISNENSLEFLQLHSYKVALQNYLCVCYGVDSRVNKVRKIEFFRFIGCIENHQGYWIESYALPEVQESNEDDVVLTSTSIFRVQDCNHLRQTIFEFQDKTSLFRSTLFYVPECQKLFRVHCVLQFLTLPILSRYSYTTTVVAEKFLVSESKKKQILKRMRYQISLLEEALKAHGALECPLPESGNEK